MGAIWVRIPRDEAQTHPLYGVRGWLAVFAVLLISETALMAVTLASSLDSQGMKLGEFLASGDGWVVFPKLILGILLITTVLILAVLLRRAPTFRPWALSALLARGPLFAAAYLYTVRGADGGLSLAPLLLLWLVESVIWVTYLQRSRRVRLTYESSVRAHLDDTHDDDRRYEHLQFVGDSHCVEPRDTGRPRAPAERSPTRSPDDGSAGQGAAEPTPTVARPPPPAAALRPNALPEAFPGPGSRSDPARQSASGRSEPHAPPAAERPHPDRFWAAALDEFEGPQRQRGLWARLLATHQGDPQRAQAQYLRLRVTALVKAFEDDTPPAA